MSVHLAGVRIGFGAGRIRAHSEGSETAAVLRRAVELGVTLIDTADVYARGLSEQRVAEALHPYPPEVVIATKGGFALTAAGPVPAGRPEQLRAACEGSRRRLRVDSIDLYQLHAPDPAVPLEESVGTLAELCAEGKIRRLGVSNVTVDQLARACLIAPIASVQNGYNVRLRRRSGPDPVVRECERLSIPYLAWRPLAAGRVTEDHAIRSVAVRKGAAPAQVALAWLLLHSPVIVPIPGTRTMGHLEQNLSAVSIRLDPEDLEELERPRAAFARPDAGDD